MDPMWSSCSSLEEALRSLLWFAYLPILQTPHQLWYRWHYQSKLLEVWKFLSPQMGSISSPSHMACSRHTPKDLSCTVLHSKESGWLWYLWPWWLFGYLQQGLSSAKLSWSQSYWDRLHIHKLRSETPIKELKLNDLTDTLTSLLLWHLAANSAAVICTF